MKWDNWNRNETKFTKSWKQFPKPFSQALHTSVDYTRLNLCRVWSEISWAEFRCHIYILACFLNGFRNFVPLLACSNSYVLQVGRTWQSAEKCTNTKSYIHPGKLSIWLRHFLLGSEIFVIFIPCSRSIELRAHGESV